MNPEVAQKLLNVNLQFYQTFSNQFSATRQRIQPGVRKILERLPEEVSILELGCGNGELPLQLSRKNHRGYYLGLDFSSPLLELAQEVNQQIVQKSPLHVRFQTADLAAPDWDTGLPENKFKVVLAFAVLHHIPGIKLRGRILRKVRRLLDYNGLFIHSEWQFLNSPRLVARIQPWSILGLSELAVDPGDYLLDWRYGGSGLRYVHFFQVEELQHLAEISGFQVVETFHSDGVGGHLSLYQTWQAK
jgi:tRNA (uracil-5-)-methyltransferase TRM9